MRPGTALWERGRLAISGRMKVVWLHQSTSEALADVFYGVGEAVLHDLCLSISGDASPYSLILECHLLRVTFALN